MGNFSEKKIQEVWDKAKIDPNNDSKVWRKDACDAWIHRDQYGKETKYGWEIDHIYPESKGGSDDIDNLRAMHWENNRSKADSYPDYVSSVTSDGTTNIKKEEDKTINKDIQKILKDKFGFY